MATRSRLIFKPDEDISERVIFPITEVAVERHRRRSLRRIRGRRTQTYYATYTAYSGRAIRSELIETTDFMSFRMTPLRGTAARNKGMALFPAQDRRPLRDDRAGRTTRTCI